ncbi:MAG: chromosomal replication initiator protein DnaA [Paludibacteraceae bacterium]|nr:chromosomal replication initiator protein DnaA [Candidatus Physcocola equi]MCQ2234591.1 chromosomal replication initiator protein DnaA [Paludibacteraceae bacterium]
MENNTNSNEKNNLEQRWGKCLNVFKDNMIDAQFEMWFQPINPISWDQKSHELKIGVPSSYFQERIDTDYPELMKATLTKFFGNGVRLTYVCQLDSDGNKGNIVTKTPPYSTPDPRKSNFFDPFFIPTKRQIGAETINRTFTMENFVEGESNKLAKSAGKAIAENPGGTPFNPMFVYGSPGCGKTHLLNAIGHKVNELHPEKNVIYVNALTFQSQYQSAHLTDNVINFMHFYRNIDVLLIDDIQELAGKEGTQNTLFHIFNSLQMAGKQLVFTSDRSPKSLEGKWEERLKNRFLWGLTAQIDKPDENMRRALLKKRVEQENLDISDEVIDLIASNCSGSNRELVGILTSLLAHATLVNAVIDVELAKTVMGLIGNTPQKKEAEHTIDLNQIKEAVCNYYNVGVDDIQTKSRKRDVAQARQVAMYLARKLTKKSLSTIGQEIGNRDHATVLHACKTVENLIETEKEMSISLEAIEKNLH